MSVQSRQPGTAEACRRLTEYRELISTRNAGMSIRYKGTTIFRLYHELFPGSSERLFLDIYGSVLLAGITGAGTAGEENKNYDDDIAALFDSLRGMPGLCCIEGLVFQRRDRRGVHIVGTAGLVPRRVIAKEDGLSYVIMPLRGQNIGLFTESAHARRVIRGCAGGVRVLNLFSYTCGFSLAALAGGAGEVVNVDMKSAFLEWGRENHLINELDMRKVRFSKLNVMKSFGRFERFGHYGIVICDPPPFQGRSYDPARDFTRLLRRSGALVSPGGLLMVILNSFSLGNSHIYDCMEAAGLIEGGSPHFTPFASVMTAEGTIEGLEGTHISIYKRLD